MPSNDDFIWVEFGWSADAPKHSNLYLSSVLASVWHIVNILGQALEGLKNIFEGEMGRMTKWKT